MYAPGEPAVSQEGPALPLENAGKMPASRQPWTMAWYQVSRESAPQELLITSGARSGRGFSPSASVGASIH